MLKWIGDQKGVLGIPGIPGRDLTDDEVAKYGGEEALLATGLWQGKSARQKKTEVEENDGR